MAKINKYIEIPDSYLEECQIPRCPHCDSTEIYDQPSGLCFACRDAEMEAKYRDSQESYDFGYLTID